MKWGSSKAETGVAICEYDSGHDAEESILSSFIHLFGTSKRASGVFVLLLSVEIESGICAHTSHMGLVTDEIEPMFKQTLRTHQF